MATSKSQKRQMLEQLTRKFQDMKSAVFFAYQGLTVKDMEDLRSQLRTSGASMNASKRTLIRLALKERGMNEMDLETMPGGLAIAFGMEDEIAPAKTAHEFSKKHEQLVIQGGLLVQGDDVQMLSADQVKSLAKLPSKEQLIAQVVGAIRAPLSGLMNVFTGNTRSFLNVLNAIKDSKQ